MPVIKCMRKKGQCELVMNGGSSQFFHVTSHCSAGCAVDGLWKPCKVAEEFKSSPGYGVSSTIEIPYEQGRARTQVTGRM